VKRSRDARRTPACAQYSKSDDADWRRDRSKGRLNLHDTTEHA
jgi:hypothetical protein